LQLLRIIISVSVAPTMLRRPEPPKKSKPRPSA